MDDIRGIEENIQSGRVTPAEQKVYDEYVNASTKERIEMVWDITIQLWSIAEKGGISAQSRLQRHVANFTKA